MEYGTLAALESFLGVRLDLDAMRTQELIQYQTNLLIFILPLGMTCVLMWVRARGNLGSYFAAAAPFLFSAVIGWWSRDIFWGVGVFGWCLPLAAGSITLVCLIRVKRWWGWAIQLFVAWLCAVVCLGLGGPIITI